LQLKIQFLITNSLTAQETLTRVRFKVKDLAVLTKMRLASLVVFSAFLGYLLAAQSVVWMDVFFLVIGGFLVTGSSNGFNQIIEKDIDKLMDRTKNRPIPSGRMSVKEATWISIVYGILGIAMLWFGLNPLSGILGSLALFVYVFIYTPLKKHGPIAVLAGAFPGAVPPMLGYVAESGQFGLVAGVLFAVQFAWQFPHFWSIAWKVNDDYNKADYFLLPTRFKDKTSSLVIVLSSILLIPVSLIPTYLGIGGNVAMAIVFLSGLAVLYFSIRLHLGHEEKMASRLMFSTFFYLPIVQLAYLMSI
jgi:protoheme IX farnesyltransferase|tara:strand:+ start:494 stop:1405 length:912 start_codon:yes stop_codon:yes gene_type:complete